METRQAADGSPFDSPGGVQAPPGEVSEAEVQLALHYARALAFMLVVTGLLQVAQVAQLLLFVDQRNGEIVFAEVLFALQAAAMWGVALRVSDGSSRFTLVAAVLALGSALSAGSWWLWLLLHGAVSLLPLGIAPTSALTGLLCLLFLRFASRIERARSDLELG
jgi:hypothetical protein